MAETSSNTKPLRLDLQKAKLAILEHQYKDAEASLDTIAQNGFKDRKLEADVLFQLAKSQMFQKDHSNSIANLTSALTIYEELNDDYGILEVYNNIGFNYHNQSEYERANVYYKKSLAVATKIHNNRGISRARLNISNISKALGEEEVAEEYTLQALLEFEEEGNSWGIIAAGNNIVSIYVSRDDIGRALRYANLIF